MGHCESCDAPNLLELVLGVGRGILVWMILDRSPAICLFEIKFINIGTNAELQAAAPSQSGHTTNEFKRYLRPNQSTPKLSTR